MIRAKLINSDAELNSFFEIGSIDYTPGENLTIAIRLFDSQRDIRYIPNVAAEVKLFFINKDSTELEKTATLIDADDRSMVKVELSQAETQNLAAGNIRIELDELGDDTDISLAIIRNALSRVILSGDC